MSTQAIPKTKSVLSIQYMRGLAALGVCGFHAQTQVGITGTNFLQGGIEIFFLISGYIMWITTSNRMISPGQFALRRLARVLPIYWAVTSLVVAVLLIAPNLAQTARLDWSHVIASYLFVPWQSPSPGVGLKPLIIPGWTLNYEMFFYAVFCLALFLPQKVRGWVVLAFLGLISFAGFFPERLSPIAAFYASPLTAEFGVGVIIAMAVERIPSRLASLGLPIFVYGFASLIVGGTLMDAQASDRFLWVGLPAILMVGGATLWERTYGMPRIRLLNAIGDASYSLYLIHPLLLSVVGQAWRRFLPEAPAPLFVPLAVAAMTIGGLVVYRLVEKPLTDALQSWLSRRPRPCMGPAPAIAAKSA